MNIPRLVATQPQVPLASNISLDGDFIQLRGVRKAYGEQLVVMDDMNLDMRADDRLVIIGPSGSGKSSLLRVLMGLEGIRAAPSPSRASPTSMASDATAKPLDESLRTQIGMVFQHYTLFPHLSVLGNLILAPCRVRGWSGPRPAQRPRLPCPPGPGKQVARLPQPAFRRPEAARGDRSRADARTPADVVRRSHFGARPGDGHRGAERDAATGRAEDGDDHRHPRHAISPVHRHPSGVLREWQGGRAGPPRTDIQPTRKPAPASSWKRSCTWTEEAAS